MIICVVANEVVTRQRALIALRTEGAALYDGTNIRLITIPTMHCVVEAKKRSSVSSKMHANACVHQNSLR
jgi:hypothetical protein